MNDSLYALMFLTIFAVCVIVYGFIIRQTGDKNWLPLRTWPTISSEEDVRHVGSVTMRVGFVMLIVFGLPMLFVYFSA